ncbi:hypothetical protein SAMN02745146_3312 [Hymenobacter daecheongensis DSM 21074]|uniref:Uncharacterized protein n=2 Tax=Hymenobacter daecheongensis TaxID=496053 RepID=A0A1M6JY64_9BACT|nr:hypothetical protein SAMN02745146_3312 [Hymenobacter daecheongensis DSM 21074]
MDQVAVYANTASGGAARVSSVIFQRVIGQQRVYLQLSPAPMLPVKRLLKRLPKADVFTKQVQTELRQQLRAVGTLSETCQETVAEQLSACVPLLLSYHPTRVSGWQDKVSHGAHLIINFRNDSQLTVAEYCPAKDAAPDAADTRIFIHRRGTLQSYIACHHTKLQAALHRTLPALAADKQAA